MVVTEKDGKLTIVMDLNKDGILSSTGKTLSYGSSGGNIATTVLRDGKPLKVGVNVFTVIPKAERVAIPA